MVRGPRTAPRSVIRPGLRPIEATGLQD